MTTTNAGFPALKPIPQAVSDHGVHLGDSAITGRFPRRQLLTSAVALLGLGVAACADLPGVVGKVGDSVSDSATQITDDINQLAAGLSGILPDVKAVTGLAAGAVTTVQNSVAKVKDLAAQVAAAVKGGVTLAAPIISQIASAVGAISGTLSGSGVALPSWVSTVLLAAKTVLPIALSLAGVALAAPPSTGMTASQARAILSAAAMGRPA